jgi:hypothetical protein
MKDDMRRRAAVTGAAIASILLPASALARPSGWPPVADGQVTRGGAIAQATRTMSLDLPGSADAAFPLFGPAREQEWSPEWAPGFVVPTSPGQSADGAVFTLDHQPTPMVWVMTDYDAAERIVRYVVVRAGRAVTQLWIQVIPVSAAKCRADVTYRYTSLGPDGDQGLAHFVESFPGWKHHWESAIGPVLARGAGAGQATGRP